MNEMKIAVMSDVHGNMWAIEAVMNDIEKRGISVVINLGDCISGPLEPRLTAERLIETNVICVRGNNDRALILDIDENKKNNTYKYVKNSLSKNHIDWLKRMPSAFIYDNDIYACHGTPMSDKIYMLEEVSKNGVALKEEGKIAAYLSNITQSVILCGHSHLPRTVYLNDGRIVVNPGSVGLPAYSDSSPIYHEMVSGSPSAKYAVLSKNSTTWKVEHISLDYDWNSAANRARENERLDWAQWILKGHCK